MGFLLVSFHSILANIFPLDFSKYLRAPGFDKTISLNPNKKQHNALLVHMSSPPFQLPRRPELPGVCRWAARLRPRGQKWLRKDGRPRKLRMKHTW